MWWMHLYWTKLNGWQCTNISRIARPTNSNPHKIKCNEFGKRETKRLVVAAVAYYAIVVSRLKCFSTENKRRNELYRTHFVCMKTDWERTVILLCTRSFTQKKKKIKWMDLYTCSRWTLQFNGIGSPWDSSLLHSFVHLHYAVCVCAYSNHILMQSTFISMPTWSVWSSYGGHWLL